MKVIKSSKFPHLAIAAALVGFQFSKVAQATGTDLPYIGPTQMSCAVNAPDSAFESFDAGFLANENCSIVYVKPPLIGDVYLAGGHLNSDFEKTCKRYLRGLDAINSEVEQLERELSRVSSVEGARLRAERMPELIESLNDHHDLYGNKHAVTVAAATNLKWNALINAYQKANPEKVVARVPIAIGLLDVARVSSPADDILSTAPPSGVGGLDITGARVARSATESYPDFPMPSFAEQLIASMADTNQQMVLMGQSVAMRLRLNYSAACGAFESSGKPKPSVANLIVGTYTYFYPVQSKAEISVSINEEAFKTIAIEHIRKSGGLGITTDDFLKAFEGQESHFNVSVKEAAFAGFERSEELKKEYQKTMRESVLDMILGKLASETQISINVNTETHYRTERYKKCKREWYGGRTCHTKEYTIPYQTVNWNQVFNEVKNMYVSASITNSSYVNLYLVDTVSIVPRAGN